MLRTLQSEKGKNIRRLRRVLMFL